MLHCLVFQDPPVDFNPKLQAAGCYCEHKDRLLLLHRSPNSPQGYTWGIPAGKFEINETPIQAAIRELYEETGLSLKAEDLQPVGKLFVRHPNIDFIFHLFQTSFESEPALFVDPKEHLEAKWATVKEALELPLIAGGIDTLNFYLRFKYKKALNRSISPTPFYYVRHGECNKHPEHLTDDEDMHISLNDNGHRQAHSIKQHIEQLPIKTVCVSPMKRAQQTLEIIGCTLNCPKIVIDDLKECNLATWLEMTQEPFKPGHLTEKFFERALRGINRALEYPGPVLIVAHGGIHWALTHMVGVSHEKKILHCVPVHFNVDTTQGWQAKILAKPFLAADNF